MATKCVTRYVREMVTKSRTGAKCAQNHRTQIFLTHTLLLNMECTAKWNDYDEEKKTISILIICSKNCLFIKIKCNFRVNNGKTWKSMQSISDFIMMITGASVRTQHLTPISNHMSKIIIFDFRCHLQCCAVLCEWESFFHPFHFALSDIAFVRFASLAKAPTQWRFTHNNGNKIRKWICVSHLVAPQHWLNFSGWFLLSLSLSLSMPPIQHLSFSLSLSRTSPYLLYHSKFSHNRQQRHSVEFFMIDSGMNVSF